MELQEIPSSVALSVKDHVESIAELDGPGTGTGYETTNSMHAAHQMAMPAPLEDPRGVELSVWHDNALAWRAFCAANATMSSEEEDAKTDPYQVGFFCKKRDEIASVGVAAGDPDIPNLGWSQWRSVAEFGQALAEGISKGETFAGSEEFFSAEHFAPPGAWSRSRELFPLPVDFESSQADPHLEEQPGARAWAELGCFALNRLAGQKGAFPQRRSAERVIRVKANLEGKIKRFLASEGKADFCSRTLWSDLKTKQISYEGEEIGNPVPLTVEQILSGLPPLGHGASVALSPLLEGKTRHLVLNPEECLLGADEKGPRFTLQREKS